ncbi:uncharacterized protein J3R85_005429 [Psidium guajava]|nr:uncharacterized protein J3R85_005429 [Psidium guajava]
MLFWDFGGSFSELLYWLKATYLFLLWDVKDRCWRKHRVIGRSASSSFY